MAKYTKEEYAAARKQSGELLKLILKKSGMSRKELIALAEHNFIAANLDLITEAEKKQFDVLIFGKKRAIK